MMLRTLLSLLIVVSLSASASADGKVYVYESVSALQMRGGLAQEFADRGMQIQLGIGYHLDSEWAVELMGRAGFLEDPNDPWNDSDLMGWGLRAKRFHLVGDGLRLYGRLGVTENFLDGQGKALAGFGFEYGGGIQYTVQAPALGLLFWPLFFTGIGPKVNLSAWADLGGEIGNLHQGHGSNAPSYNYRQASATFGVGIGGRF